MLYKLKITAQKSPQWRDMFLCWHETYVLPRVPREGEAEPDEAGDTESGVYAAHSLPHVQWWPATWLLDTSAAETYQVKSWHHVLGISCSMAVRIWFEQLHGTITFAAYIGQNSPTFVLIDQLLIVFNGHKIQCFFCMLYPYTWSPSFKFTSTFSCMCQVQEIPIL